MRTVQVIGNDKEMSDNIVNDGFRLDFIDTDGHLATYVFEHPDLPHSAPKGAYDFHINEKDDGKFIRCICSKETKEVFLGKRLIDEIIESENTNGHSN